MLGKKTAVIYFSHTGVTRELVGKFPVEEGDRIIEIVPSVPYPKSFFKTLARAKAEIEGNVPVDLENGKADLANYDRILIGFPIWWGDKPMPVYTFIDSYDFKDKNIIPFCTHEGSGFCGTQGMDKTGAKILKGLAIYGHVAQNDRGQAEKQVAEWLKGLKF